MTQYVYRFGGGVSDGGKGDKNLLGGKGANLDGMASIDDVTGQIEKLLKR